MMASLSRSCCYCLVGGGIHGSALMAFGCPGEEHTTIRPLEDHLHYIVVVRFFSSLMVLMLFSAASSAQKRPNPTAVSIVRSHNRTDILGHGRLSQISRVVLVLL